MQVTDVTRMHEGEAESEYGEARCTDGGCGGGAGGRPSDQPRCVVLRIVPALVDLPVRSAAVA
eukprot:CAMPEP_0179322124 /NCGR_PEP_ID=MMETSP0797-20121207/59002_1 /TAXON_ID=47934 /ORGANISM="Dinophysis acuminata, Strain DAEP01" /LENGTH=62 /DNA_ID=CAMNT_0021033843 /DNA_START=12 /DNA_END=196 /DNA_ORIENTATION=+